jgi:hypothetical protein
MNRNPDGIRRHRCAQRIRAARVRDAVLDHYGAGGRTITSGPYAGHGN